MSNIRFLTSDEIKIISAGEVIERPSSIVKELIENSIDAKSSFINLYIENGGLNSIEINDDGNGMSLDDMKISILPHTTSKLNCVNEIYESLNTYGFRGEALSSISSISKMTLKSKKYDSEIGNELQIEFGKIISNREIPFNKGSSIKIENIFDSIPVRKKFLKSKETEWNAIEYILICSMLSAINIKFCIYHNNSLFFNIPKSDNIISRGFALVPEKYSSIMIPCEYQDEYLSITGIISGIEYGHYDRSKIYVCINNRMIRQYKITQAIIKAYNSENFSKRYPMVYLSIKLPSKDVDINVHPRKEEVSFLHPRRVEEKIIHAISSTLENRTKNIFKNISKESESIELIKETVFEKNNISLKEDKKNEKIIQEIEKIEIIDIQERELEKPLFNKNIYSDFTKKIETLESIKILEKKTIIDEPKIIELKQETILNKNEKRFLGIFQKTYLIFENNENLILVDQHALHEKIIYESIKNEIIKNNFQTLFDPKIIIYDAYTISIIKNHLDRFKKLGILVDIFNETTILIRGFIPFIDIAKIKDTIENIISICINDKNLNNDDIHSKIIGDIACKKAIKAGDTLNNDSIKLLLENANLSENISLCPHGRPIYYNMTKYFIDSLFKRK